MNFYIASSFVVEAQAVIYGLQLASDLGFHHVILEGDSMSVTLKLKSKKDLSKISAFIYDAKQLSRGFSTCRFQFTPQEGYNDFSLLWWWLEAPLN
ncbi:hypothetical protein V6N13_125433 [Hibiscus sabdariffa]|uniref:RNase H type-1 domain-containing protein n=1 Tax=Hibiscus sabdariffa TaxID=183260 RepID=A0ABR2U5M2_9ROSI